MSLTFWGYSLQEKWKEEEWEADKISQAKDRVMAAAKILLPKVGDLKFYCGKYSTAANI